VGPTWDDERRRAIAERRRKARRKAGLVDFLAKLAAAAFVFAAIGSAVLVVALLAGLVRMVWS
jgi:hypothetical protein